MPHPVVVTPHLTVHLTVPELEGRYRQCRDAVVKIHLQAILLVVHGYGTADVAKVCGYKPHAVAGTLAGSSGARHPPARTSCEVRSDQPSPRAMPCPHCWP
ncbi:MAG: hypothetical protein ABIJ09_25300 [Pseudomonadota bacterium]